MDIVMISTTSSALADYLDREYKKRIAVNRNFSLRQWSFEIGIDPTVLNRMINGSRGQPQQISIEVLNKLLEYFGPDMLGILGIAIPNKPKNPMHGKNVTV